MAKRKHTEISGHEQEEISRQAVVAEDSAAAATISSRQAVEILLTIRKEPCLSTSCQRFSNQVVQFLIDNCCSRYHPSFKDLSRFSDFVSDFAQQIRSNNLATCREQSLLIKQIETLPKSIHTIGKQMYQHCIKKIVNAALRNVGHSPESAIQIIHKHKEDNKTTTSTAPLPRFYYVKNLKDVQQVMNCSTAEDFQQHHHHQPYWKGYCQAVSWVLKDFTYDATADSGTGGHLKYPSRHNVEVEDCVRKMLQLEIWKKLNKVIYLLVLAPAHSICRKHFLDKSRSKNVKKQYGIDSAQFSSADNRYNTALLGCIQDAFIRHANKCFFPGSREWISFKMLEVFFFSYAESNLFKSVTVPGSILTSVGNIASSSKYVYCILNHTSQPDCRSRRKKRNWLIGWAIFKHFSEHFLLVYNNE